jgi:molybdopterin-guanine dinucleotide biosynthesis protein
MMSERVFFSSIARISDLATKRFDVQSLPRSDWDSGDYVVGRVTGLANSLHNLELATGRMIEVFEGDLVVGAFGIRAATLEGVGSWQDIGDDMQMHALTSAGLCGKMTSRSLLLPLFMGLEYRGHVVRDANKVVMKDFVTPSEKKSLDIPVVLLIGTSMSAGKTTTGRIIIHELKRAGLRVVGAKLTGAARYRDVMSFSDAGADEIFDFVDVGLPSTVCPVEEFRQALDTLLSKICSSGADVLIAEAGASPLEPYNGAIAVEVLEPHVQMTVLSASDPYAVVGVQTAFGTKPDLVTGPAANTVAGAALVKKLTNVPALNLREPANLEALRALLRKTLSVSL